MDGREANPDGGDGDRGSHHHVAPTSEPAIVLRVSGRLESLFVFSVDGDAITGIRAVRNPDKLSRIDRQLGTLQQ